jgi:hypothetical protein
MPGKTDYLELKVLDVIFGYQHAILSSTNASPIVVTVSTASHAFQASVDRVSVSGHATNTAANGEWSPAAVGATTVTLTGSTGNGVGGATGTIKKILDVGITNFFGLWTTTLVDASTGSTGTEMTGGSYARASVTNNGVTWSNAAAGSKTNVATITFPTATANWSGITDWAVLDASSAGNMLYYGAFAATQSVSNGQTASWAASGITITED